VSVGSTLRRARRARSATPPFRTAGATVASVLQTPAAFATGRPVATTYTSAASGETERDAGYRPSTRDWALLDTDQLAGTQGTAVK